MLTDELSAVPRPSRGLRAAIWLAHAAVLAAGLLFILRYQYVARSLRGYDASLDLVFLLSIAAASLARVAERRGVRHAAGILLRVTVAAAMTGLALVGGEYALRFHFRDVRSSGYGRDYISSLAGGPVARFNALGFREREIGPKDPSRFRIAVIGDSFTFGNGVEERDRLSNLLQRHLGSRYEVLNFGVAGNNMPQHLQVLERVLPLAPDFVLLQLFVNDFEPEEMVRPRVYPLLPPTVDGVLYRSSITYDIASRGWGRLQELLGITESYAACMQRHLGDPGTPHSRLTSAQLRGFFQRAAAAGIPAGTVMYPATNAMRSGGRGYAFGYLHERAREACAAEHVTCVDLLDDFAKVGDLRKLNVSAFDAHPSPMANARAAIRVLQAFSRAWTSQ